MLATNLPSRSSFVRVVLAPALCAGVALAQVAGPRPVPGGSGNATPDQPATNQTPQGQPGQEQPASKRYVYEPVHSRYLRLDAYDRYGKRQRWNPLTMSDGTGEYPILRGAGLFDVYNTNKWKGDEPVIGEHTFLAAELISNNLFESRDKVGDSATEIRTTEFLTADFFHGDTAFRPPTWRVKATLGLDIRNADDVGGGDTQTDGAVQEFFGELLLWETDPYLDFGSLRLGRQAFASDFRNFVFVDNNDGVQLFGSLNESKVDFQLAFFDLAAKDPFSNFNKEELGGRNQTFWAASVFVEDMLAQGYKVEFTVQGVHDTAGFNDAFLGQIDRDVDAYYLGFNGEGHIGGLEVAHALYWMTGKDDLNQFSADSVDINAQMAAIEIAVPSDWKRYVFSALYASGDSNPTDNKGGGFDSVTDNPNFAGGAFGFFDRQGLNTGNLVDAGLNGRALVNTNSFYPNLRTKANEAPNSVNPGLIILHAGAEATLSNYWNVAVNASYLMFANTAVLEQFNTDGINSVGNGIGLDLSIAGQYRPLGVDNCIITPGIQALIPVDGFKDLSNEDALFAIFVNATIIL